MNHQPQLIRKSDGQTFDLDTETRIGRRDDCSIVLDEAGISRFHAQINIVGTNVTIEDYSRNGTQVNGAAITGVTNLAHQDVIRFDQDEYQLDCPGATADVAQGSAADSDMTQVVFTPAAATQIAEDALRKPLPDRPRDEGTQVVLPNSSGQQYQPLDYQSFSGPSLVVRNGKSAGTTFSFLDTEQRWTVGSAGNSSLRIDDDGVSSQHAVIQRTGNSWEVTDQMATNVLRVNGNVTNKCFLANGDKITLGAVDCEFVLPKGYRVREQSPTSPTGGGKSRKMVYWIIALILILAAAGAVGIYFARNYM